MTLAKAPYQMEVTELLAAMDAAETGLSTSEAERRLTEQGPNELEAKVRVPIWLVFLSQFKELLIFILIIGGIISYFIGNYRDGSIIFIIVLVNAIIGFLHERKAGKIIDKLKTLIKSPTKVMRDGKLTEISPEKLVPGDIVQVEAGRQASGRSAADRGQRVENQRLHSDRRIRPPGKESGRPGRGGDAGRPGQHGLRRDDGGRRQRDRSRDRHRDEDGDR